MQSFCDYPDKFSSLGEVQRIIGLSLSKIQIGRSQRGGLPLHKNLLVATVLNKARDLYMQETMYMNYKMMTGHQFGMTSSVQSSSVPGPSFRPDDEEMEEAPEPEDYEEDSESDVEDEVQSRSCELASSNRAALAASMVYPASTMAAMMMQAACSGLLTQASSANETGRLTPLTPSIMQSRLQDSETTGEQTCDDSFVMHGSFQHLHHLSQLHYQQQLQQAEAVHRQQQAEAALQQQQSQHAEAGQQQSTVNDEGFIDDPDCDCDARNFSTSHSRIPFRYCQRCAPFHSANGRGPTLVPAPSSCPSLPSPESAHSEEEDNAPETTSQNIAPAKSCSGVESNITIYDMDSKSTERRSPCAASPCVTPRHGTKRRRKMSDQDCRVVDNQVGELSTKRRRSSEGESCQEKHDTFHPAFRGSPETTTSSTQQAAGMEIDQITSLVSIFSFGHHMNTTGSNQPETDICQTAEKPAEEDSDSESDTSSDSGHSSDDHDISSDKDKEEPVLTKLTRSVSTPDLCSTSANSSSKETSPRCVEVASV